MRCAETYAAVHGWCTGRHRDYPTDDIPVDKLGHVGVDLRLAIRSRVFPEIATRFDLQPGSLGIQDLFLVKYSMQPGAMKELEPHVDSSDFSFVIALNDLSEYEGGGTRFLFAPVPEPVFRLALGYATLFCGKNRHQGVAITKGTRYILAGFLDCNGEGKCVGELA